MKSYRKQILLAGAFVLIAGIAQAQEACNTSGCQGRKQQGSTTVQKPPTLAPTVVQAKELQALFPIGDLLLGRDSSVIKGISKATAANYCAMRRQRLPTIREFAVQATRKCTPEIIGDLPCGAEMLELSQASCNTVPEGFYLVTARNPDGKIDEFLYRHDNYQRPDKRELSELWTWSSDHSGFNYSDRFATAYSYFFNGYTGHIQYYERDFDDVLMAIRCIDR